VSTSSWKYDEKLLSSKAASFADVRQKYIPVLSGSVILKYVVGMLDWSTIKLAKSVEVEICSLYETTLSFSGSVAVSHIKLVLKCS